MTLHYGISKTVRMMTILRQLAAKLGQCTVSRICNKGLQRALDYASWDCFGSESLFWLLTLENRVVAVLRVLTSLFLSLYPSVLLVMDFSLPQRSNRLHSFCTAGSRMLWKMNINSPWMQLAMQNIYWNTIDEPGIRARKPNTHVKPTNG